MPIEKKKSMHYKKNYLTKVILRIDFNPITRLQTEKNPEFSKKIEGKYPYVKGRPTTQINFSISPSGSGIEQQDTGMVWEHRNEEKSEKIISLAPNSMSIDCGKYQYDHYPPFREEVKYLFDNFIDTYKIEEVSRIGLRFINDISLTEGNPLEWNGFINEKLSISSTAGLLDGMKLIRSMHQLHALYDDISVLFNYGIYNPDFPNPVARKNFILDYDCYITGGVKSPDVLRRLDDLNKVAENMFETSIQEKLRENMEEIHE